MLFSWPEISPVYHISSLDVELSEIFSICQADIKVRACLVNTEI